MNINSSKQLTTHIGRLRLKRCGSTPALTVFVAFAPTSNYDEKEIDAFYMELEKFFKEDHTFYTAIVVDFNAKVAPEERRKNFTSGSMDYNGTNRGKGYHSLSWRRKPSLALAVPETAPSTLDVGVARWRVT